MFLAAAKGSPDVKIAVLKPPPWAGDGEIDTVMEQLAELENTVIIDGAEYDGRPGVVPDYRNYCIRRIGTILKDDGATHINRNMVNRRLPVPKA